MGKPLGDFTITPYLSASSASTQRAQAWQKRASAARSILVRSPTAASSGTILRHSFLASFERWDGQ